MSISLCPYGKGLNRKFLELPRHIYSADVLTQSVSDEKALLEGKHVLSRYFDFYPILALSGKAPAARGAVTVYHGDETAYFGFFESIRSRKAAAAVFDEAERIAKEKGCKRICGPVDASFWIKYRLKVNHFEQPPYTGEPYNMPYYERLFLEAGYKAEHQYKSMRFKPMTENIREEKFARRLEEKLSEGYIIKSPSAKSFGTSIREVYRMLISLYSDFPAYKFITEDEFVSIYSSLEFILDYSMVKIAYKDGKAVGFYISVPNICNLSAGRLTPGKLLKILQIKKRPQEYVMLYMGVDEAHHGLGKALVQTIEQELVKNGASSIGALIRTGKITGEYYSDYAEFDYIYRLYGKEL